MTYIDTYKLNDLSNRRMFRGVPGVYVLIFNNEPIYVGQSKDIMKRMGQHNSKCALKQVEKNIEESPEFAYGMLKRRDMYRLIDKCRDSIYFGVLYRNGEFEQRCKVEEEFIAKFQPRYNYRGVDVPYKA